MAGDHLGFSDPHVRGPHRAPAMQGTCRLTRVTCHVSQGFREMGGIRGVELSRDMEAWRQRVVWLRGKALELASANGNGSGKGSSNGGGGGGGGSVAARLAALPDLSDAGLLATAGTWLVPHLSGVRTKGDILKLPWGNILKWVHGRMFLVCTSCCPPPAVTRKASSLVSL